MKKSNKVVLVIALVVAIASLVICLIVLSPHIHMSMNLQGMWEACYNAYDKDNDYYLELSENGYWFYQRGKEVNSPVGLISGHYTKEFDYIKLDSEGDYLRFDYVSSDNTLELNLNSQTLIVFEKIEDDTLARAIRDALDASIACQYLESQLLFP